MDNETATFPFQLHLSEKGVTTNLFGRMDVGSVHFPRSNQTIRILKDPVHIIYRIDPDSWKGELPAELNQGWTTANEVGKAISAYFSRMYFEKQMASIPVPFNDE